MNPALDDFRPVKNIEKVLQVELKEAQSAMEQRLAQTTLSQLTAKFD